MKVSIKKADITEIDADAIVNAASSSLLGGGGVDGAIHRKAGPKLLEECREIRKERYPDGLPTGQAVATKGYNLKARHVIHTVGPIYKKQELSLLKDGYLNSLKIAEQLKCRKIAFPAISTGVYGVPIEESINVVQEVIDHYKSGFIEEIILVLFDEEDYEKYKKELNVTF